MSEPIPETFAWQRPGSRFASGMVTAPGVLPLDPQPEAPPEPPPDGPRRRRQQMLIFAGIAGAILAVGLTVILVMALSGEGDIFRRKEQAPTDVRPPLAQACPAPTASPSAAPT